MATEVSRWLSKKEAESVNNSSLASEWSSLDRLYSARLYHQLTIKLLDFCKHPSLQSEGQLVELYYHFLKDFETRICPLSLMEIVVLITRQMDTQQALNFLNSIEPKIASNKAARALCHLTRAEVQLVRMNDISHTKQALEKTSEILDTIDGVSSVHGRFYLLQSNMFDRMNDKTQYYKSALKFLGCTDLSSLTYDEQRLHAERLSVAALIADGIYNFGELLGHPILQSLRRTNEEFLIDVLRAFNSGNIQEFKKLKNQWQQIAELKMNVDALHEKIILLCLMEMTFKRPSFERQLSFAEITDATGLVAADVELYVMKAVSKGLIKGRIDQVGQKVYMTWVQPRVLERSQIATMVTRLDGWQKTISSMERLVSDEAADILT